MIFVLGAKGFVGSAVLAELQGLGACAGIDTDNYAHFQGRPCDILVNVNGNAKKYLADEDPAAEFDLSVRSVVRSLHDFPAARYVLISTVDVYTDFRDPEATAESAPIEAARQSRYGFHKWLAEAYVTHAAASWLIVRLGGMVGPGLRKGPVFDLIHDIPLRVHLDSRYQVLHTRTVGRILRALIERGTTGEVFNVCGTGTVSLREVAAMIGRSVPEDPSLERQHYEINTAKLLTRMHVPQTTESVTAYLREEGLL